MFPICKRCGGEYMDTGGWTPEMTPHDCIQELEQYIKAAELTVESLRKRLDEVRKDLRVAVTHAQSQGN